MTIKEAVTYSQKIGLEPEYDDGKEAIRIIEDALDDGYGFIECAHGTMPVPVPATSEIFASSNVKFRQIDIDTELVTPTRCCNYS